MLDKTIYINHLNQRINFGSDGIFATGSDARDGNMIRIMTRSRTSGRVLLPEK